MPETGAAKLQTLLVEFEGVLRTHAVPLNDNVADGLSRDDVRARFASIDITPPEELVEWFHWKNGIVTPAGEPGATVIPTVIPASLDWAIAAYEAGRAYPGAIWSHEANWFPIEQDSHSLNVSCRDDSASAPLVRRADEDFPLQVDAGNRQLVSLCTVIEMWLESIATGAVVWNESTVDWITDYSLLSPAAVESGLW